MPISSALEFGFPLAVGFAAGGAFNARLGTSSLSVVPSGSSLSPPMSSTALSTTDGDSRQFVFNGDNKQTEVKNANGLVVGRYFYDGEGKRVKKKIYEQDGFTVKEETVFVYSGGKLVAEYSTVPAPTNPTTSYTATDHLGSPRVITDASGQVTSRRDFMPFGEELNPDSNYRKANDFKYGQSDSVRQRFTGYQKDAETNLDFAEARMYENRHGRFTAVDPLLASGKSANPQTFNRYVYVMNNPLILTDPTGLCPTCHQGPVYTKKVDNRTLYSTTQDDKSWVLFEGDTVFTDTFTGVEYRVYNYGEGSNGGSGWYPTTRESYGFTDAVQDTGIGVAKWGWNSAASISNGFYWVAGRATFEFIATGRPREMPSTEYWEPTNQTQANAGLAMTGISLYWGSVSAARTSTLTRPSYSFSYSTEALNGAKLEFLTEAQINKIQSFADKRQVEVTLFGSRASGTATNLSDWDYLIEASYGIRNNAKIMLPKGDKGIGRSPIEVFKPSNFPHDIFGQPKIIFRPNKVVNQQ